MPWTKRELKRSFPCNGKLVQKLRLDKGWSQKTLARQSGYSERFISKAESGGSLTAVSLEDLALTLSSSDRRVFPEELTTDSIAIAKSFTHALHFYRGDFVDHILHLVNEDTVFRIAGDPVERPFAGIHHGVEQFRQAVDLFFQYMEIPEDIDPNDCYEYFAENDDVIVWGQSWFHPKGEPEKAPVAVTQRLKFCDGKIISFEERFISPVVVTVDSDTSPLRRSNTGIDLALG